MWPWEETQEKLADKEVSRSLQYNYKEKQIFKEWNPEISINNKFSHMQTKKKCFILFYTIYKCLFVVVLFSSLPSLVL